MYAYAFVQKGQVFFPLVFLTRTDSAAMYLYLYILILYNTHTECVQGLLYCVNTAINLADVVRVFSPNLNQMSRKYIILGGRELG